MKVEVTRVEFIPTTTVDHTYEGKGYGLIFKLESDQATTKSDVVMQEADPDEDANGAKGGKQKEVAKDANLAPLGGPTNTKFGQQNQSSNSDPPNLQEQCSMPVWRVGQIDCIYTPEPQQIFYSESRISEITPRRLWSESDNEVDDSLPSPLPRFVF
jgi:hypothetical protein